MTSRIGSVKETLPPNTYGEYSNYLYLYMTDIEVDSLIQKLEKYRVRISKSEQRSKEFLRGAGIITKRQSEN
jgi:hypothetical protein